MSTSVLKALPGKLDIKRHSPSILYISKSLTMSTSVLKALPGKLDIKRHSPSILYISASLAMSTSILKALPGKLDIKRHSPSILYLLLPDETARQSGIESGSLFFFVVCMDELFFSVCVLILSNISLAVLFRI